MSENLIHNSVAAEISKLSELANSSCEGFAHRLYNSRVDFAGPGEQNIFNFQVPANSALIITAIDIKVLYDIADAALVGDFRSTFDLNPYGPYSGIGDVGQIRLLVDNQQYGATANDIGVINHGILLVIESERTLTVKVDPFQPAAKNLTLVSVLEAFTVPEAAGIDLKKKQTQILAGIP